MTNRDTPSDLARQAAARAAAALQHGSENRGQGAAPGDVFVLPDNSDQPVQWVVLARDPARPGQVLLVAADANQLVGTADLVVGDDALGPLVIRRPFGGWLAAARLSPDRRVGTLRLDRLSRARDHWFGEPTEGSVTTREVDEDPEYQHWNKTVLQPSYRKLFETDTETKAEPRPKPKPQWPAFAAAAALLMAVGAVWLHQKQIQEILRDKALAEERLASEIKDLQTTQQESAERHQVELEEQQRWVEDYEEKLARAGNDPGLRSILSELRTRLRDAWSSVAVVNPALATLRPVGTRGRVEVELPEGASHAVLLLTVKDDVESGDDVSFRLDVLHADTTEPFWSLEGLEIHSFNEIKVGVPAVVFERGLPYDLRLVREGESEVEGGFYQIRIR